MKNKYVELNNIILDNHYYKSHFDSVVRKVRELETNDYNVWLFECPEIYELADVLTGYANDYDLLDYIKKGLLPLIDKHRFIYTSEKKKDIEPMFYTTGDCDNYDVQIFYDFSLLKLFYVYNYNGVFIVEHKNYNYSDIEGQNGDLFEPLEIEKYENSTIIEKYITIYTNEEKQKTKVRTLKSQNDFETYKGIAVYFGLNVFNGFNGFNYENVYIEKGELV